jgi:hypothetical protein
MSSPNDSPNNTEGIHSGMENSFLFGQKEAKEEPTLVLPETTTYAPLYLDHYTGLPMDPTQASYLHHNYYAPEVHPRYSVPYQLWSGYEHHPDGTNSVKGQQQQMPQIQPTFEDDHPVTCPHDGCGKIFKKQTTYHQHLKTHTNTPKPFLCRICSFSFSRSHGNYYLTRSQAP